MIGRYLDYFICSLIVIGLFLLGKLIFEGYIFNKSYGSLECIWVVV